MKKEVKVLSFKDAEEFFTGENKCELVLEDEAFWKTRGGNPKENFEILKGQEKTVWFFLYILDGKPISHFTVQLLPCMSGNSVGYMFWFYTMKAYRGKGHSQKFLGAVLSTIQDIFKGKIGVRTDEDNEVARHIYEKLGFELGDTEVIIENNTNTKPEVEYILTKPVIEIA